MGYEMLNSKFLFMQLKQTNVLYFEEKAPISVYNYKRTNTSALIYFLPAEIHSVLQKIFDEYHTYVGKGTFFTVLSILRECKTKSIKTNLKVIW